MKKVSTKAEHFVKEVNGIKVNFWTKVCPVCGKQYETSSRTQKFCSDVCCVKAQKRKRKQQKEYSEVKELARLASRAHSVGVEVMTQLSKLGIIERQCACGCTENLQVHHKNLKYLDNSPENLMWVCPKCHSKIHSDIENTLKEKGLTKESLYSELEFNLYKTLLK